MFRPKSDVIFTLILMGDIFAFVDSYFQPNIADTLNIFLLFLHWWTISDLQFHIYFGVGINYHFFFFFSWKRKVFIVLYLPLMVLFISITINHSSPLQHWQWCHSLKPVFLLKRRTRKKSDFIYDTTYLGGQYH